MDELTAKELDNVLNSFRGKGLVSMRLEIQKDSQEKAQTFPLTDYLNELIDKGYLRYDGMRYVITFKGKTFKGFYNEYKLKNGLFNKEVRHVLFSGFVGALIGGLLPLGAQLLLPDKVQKINIDTPVEIKSTYPQEKQNNEIQVKLPAKTDTLVVKTISIKQKKK